MTPFRYLKLKSFYICKITVPENDVMTIKYGIKFSHPHGPNNQYTMTYIFEKLNSFILTAISAVVFLIAAAYTTLVATMD